MNEKVIIDGKIAVLLSNGKKDYNGGWSTCDHMSEYPEKLMFDPTIVNWILNGRKSEAPLLDIYLKMS